MQVMRLRHEKTAVRRPLVCLLRGRESNPRLEVMSLPRYLSSTPLCNTRGVIRHYYTQFTVSGKSNAFEFAEHGLVSLYRLVRERLRKIERGTLVRYLIAHFVRLPCVL